MYWKELKPQSFWANPIEELYAEVIFPDFPEANLRTPNVRLEDWSNKTLEGFLDTSTLEGGIIPAEIFVHYGEKSTKELIGIEIIPGVDKTLYFVIFGLVMVVVLTGWRFWIFLKRAGKIK